MQTAKTLNQITLRLDLSEFEALAEDKINVRKELKFILGKVENFPGKGEEIFENMMGKEENAGNQHHFLLFPVCFLSIQTNFGILAIYQSASLKSLKLEVKVICLLQDQQYQDHQNKIGSYWGICVSQTQLVESFIFQFHQKWKLYSRCFLA